MAAEGRRQDRGRAARREDDRVRRREGGQASRGTGDGGAVGRVTRWGWGLGTRGGGWRGAHGGGAGRHGSGEQSSYLLSRLDFCWRGAHLFCTMDYVLFFVYLKLIRSLLALAQACLLVLYNSS